MSVPGDDPRAAQSTSPASRAALGAIAGFSLLALTNALAIAWTIPAPRDGIALRAAHHAFDAAETLGLGALVALLLGLWLRFVALPAWAALLVHGAALSPILYAVIGGDVFRQASVTLDGRFEAALFGVYMGLLSLGLPIAQAAGAFLSRGRWLRLVAVAISVAAFSFRELMTRSPRSELDR